MWGRRVESVFTFILNSVGQQQCKMILPTFYLLTAWDLLRAANSVEIRASHSLSLSLSLCFSICLWPWDWRKVTEIKGCQLIKSFRSTILFKTWKKDFFLREKSRFHFILMVPLKGYSTVFFILNYVISLTKTSWYIPLLSLCLHSIAVARETLW